MSGAASMLGLAYVITDARGAIGLVSDGARPLCSAGTGDAIRRAVEAAARTGRRRFPLPDLGTLEVHALVGGEPGSYLVQLQPCTLGAACPLLCLSPVQLEVAVRAAAGELAPAIAAALAMSVATARTHVQAIYRRLDVSSRSDLARVVQHAHAGGA